MPESEDYMRAWLRGFFDSEGSAPDPANRRVKASNTDMWLLDLAKRYLRKLGIRASLQLTVGGNPTKNQKPCYSVAITNQENLLKFSSLVGFTNPQKQKALDKALASYRKQRAGLSLTRKV